VSSLSPKVGVPIEAGGGPSWARPPLVQGFGRADGSTSAFRVLRPGGFLQFSILHPCFNPPHRRNCRDEDQVTHAIEVGDYFVDARGHVDEWIFGTAPVSVRSRLPKFRIPRFHRPVSQWLNLLIDTGFVIERIGEPCPSPETVRAHPSIQDAQVAAYFLHLRVRKAEISG